jgi:uncharacterized membrane protein
MPEQKNSGPWTITIQGEGAYGNAEEKDVEALAEQFAAHFNSGGHRIHQVRLAVGNEKTYADGEWHHAHPAV